MLDDFEGLVFSSPGESGDFIGWVHTSLLFTLLVHIMAGEIVHVAVEWNGGRKYGGIYQNPPYFDAIIFNQKYIIKLIFKFII